MNILKPISEKCKHGKCKHKKCECGHCKNYHVGYGECAKINQDLTTCKCKQFKESGSQ